MAASAWTVPSATKKLLGQGSLVLSSGNFKLVLVKSGATMLSEGLSATTWASLKTDGVTEVTSGGGYSTSGEALAGVVWTRSGTAVKFDCTDFSLSVTADLSKIRAALIRASAGDRVVCYASLSSSAFDLSSGNKLTLTLNSAGIFTLD